MKMNDPRQNDERYAYLNIHCVFKITYVHINNEEWVERSGESEGECDARQNEE